MQQNVFFLFKILGCHIWIITCLSQQITCLFHTTSIVLLHMGQHSSVVSVVQLNVLQHTLIMKSHTGSTMLCMHKPGKRLNVRSVENKVGSKLLLLFIESLRKIRHGVRSEQHLRVNTACGEFFLNLPQRWTEKQQVLQPLLPYG